MDNLQFMLNQKNAQKHVESGGIKFHAYLLMILSVKVHIFNNKHMHMFKLIIFVAAKLVPAILNDLMQLSTYILVQT